MTVEEIVKKRAQRLLADMKRDCPEALDSPASSLAALWIDAIRDLGIWDAEVHEWVVDDSDTSMPTQLLTPERHGLPLWDMGLRHDDRVRVIVVPLE